ncbi:unnamed protein product [Rhizophagus irregularis]|nr:unnamed protein product [Rhizophagus irregularis]
MSGYDTRLFSLRHKMKAFGGLGGFLIFVLAFDDEHLGPATTPHGRANEGSRTSVSGNILGTLGAADTGFAFSNKSLQFELWHR